MDITGTITTAQTIGWLYLLTSASRIAAYGPQIALVRRSTDGARSVSLATWLSATVSHAVAAVYGFGITHDIVFGLIAVGNAVGSGAILGLALWQRHERATSGALLPGVLRAARLPLRGVR